MRNAAAILQATNPDAFDEIVGVLTEFRLEALDITEPGGGKSRLAIRVDETFRRAGSLSSGGSGRMAERKHGPTPDRRRPRTVRRAASVVALAAAAAVTGCILQSGQVHGDPAPSISFNDATYAGHWTENMVIKD